MDVQNADSDQDAPHRAGNSERSRLLGKRKPPLKLEAKSVLKSEIDKSLVNLTKGTHQVNIHVEAAVGSDVAGEERQVNTHVEAASCSGVAVDLNEKSEEIGDVSAILGPDLITNGSESDKPKSSSTSFVGPSGNREGGRSADLSPSRGWKN